MAKSKKGCMMPLVLGLGVFVLIIIGLTWAFSGDSKKDKPNNTVVERTETRVKATKVEVAETETPRTPDCRKPVKTIYAPIPGPNKDVWSTEEWSERVNAPAQCTIIPTPGPDEGLYRMGCWDMKGAWHPDWSKDACWNYLGLAFQKVQADENDTTPLEIDITLTPNKPAA